MEAKDVNYCVILAGGIGSRLWPVSRKELPKQFLDWFGTGRTLLQQTYDRFRKIIDAKHIFIVTNEHYADLVREQLPDVAQDRILKEPIRRNTLPSVAWATTCISHLCPHGNVIVSPADQLILEENNFDNDVLKGLDFVGHSDCLLTMGVKPTRPDTGYGYIQAHENMEEGAFARVKSFTEKPALDFARVFMESGEFYWNTGLYLYNVRTMMKAIHDLVPDYRDSLTEAIDAIDEDDFCRVPAHFDTLPNLSLDYSILEKSENVYVQVCDFGWADLGSWCSLHNDTQHDRQDNVLLNTEALLYNSEGNVICLPKGRIAVIDGLKGFVVAEKGDVLMICPKDDSAALRRMMTDAQMKLGEEFM